MQSKFNLTEDLLKRSEEADSLKNYLLKRYEQIPLKPFTLNINAEWGYGKTYFLQQLANKFAVDGHPVVYFDAWKNDYTKEPLLAFMSELNGQLDEYLDKREQKAKNILKKIAEFSLPIIFSIIAKRFTGYSVDQLNEMLSEDKELDKNKVENQVSTLVSNMTKITLEEHFRTKNSINDFKENMKNLLTKIESYKNKKLPLFILIDELDRCRPNYAIELLENIKHLFDIEGVYFIIATDSRQLSHSINAVYGVNFASEKYLKRFFDLEYTLKTPEVYDFAYYLFNHYNLLNHDKFFVPFEENEYKEKNLNIVAFELMAQFFKLVPRDIEQTVSMLSTICLTWNEEHKIHLIYMLFLIMLKHKSNSDFEKYLTKSDWITSVDCPLNVDKTIGVNQRYVIGNEARKNILLTKIIERYSKLENIAIKTFFNIYDRSENPIENNIYNLIENEKGITSRLSSEVLKSSIQTYKDKILHCGQFDIISKAK
ncbi:hypothetical protein SJPD1_1210 [Sulfurospirillum diekertiae]|uniref:KAP NTPase domain-containing protein n=1 Tax=Sulfurospirillum diekertiae TaxID=1854492 RepID=A0A290HUI6_9BACT|nr:P-loop NTPase fold protein [Sulfurospirillum diekertiae]ATB69320.1 hypothetical protein SJPD1_1210 [Sulfurospirillum diekertiae]